MFKQSNSSVVDPIDRVYRRYLHRVKVTCTIFIVLGAVFWLVGVPHIQTTYRFRGSRPRNGIPTTQQKTAADYLSITGWQHVDSGQYGQEGCPYILFIPLKDCLE